MDIRLSVTNAADLTVADSDQNVVWRTTDGDVSAVVRDGLWLASLPPRFSAPTRLTLEITNPRFQPFSATFDVRHSPQLGLPVFKNAEGGMAHAVALTTDLIDAVAIISKVVQADTKPDPLKIAAPQDGN